MNQSIDRSWFDTTIRRRGISQNELARRVDMHTSALSLVLSGDRRLKLGEAVQIALELGVAIHELIAAFGFLDLELEGRKPPTGYVNLTDPSDSVILDAPTDPESGGVAAMPWPGYRGQMLRIVGDGGSPRYLDGELIVISAPHTDMRHFVGREVVAKLADSQAVLKRLEAGTQPERYNLVSLNPTTPVLIDVAVEWVAAIDWHKP
jgi:transcriptional regulator with XRE-family HTH domain